MNNIKKYLFIRNFAFSLIIGNLLDWYFPFPGIVWKIAFVLLCFYSVVNEHKRTNCENAILLFALFNLLHFILSYLWTTPHISVIGGCLFGLLSLCLFSYLARKGVMTESFFTVIIIIALGAAILYYRHSRIERIAHLGRIENITVNASVVFLMLIPMLFLIKNNILKWVILAICVFFLQLGAKRGNIVASIIPITLFIVSEFRGAKRSFLKSIGVIAVFAILSFITYNWVQNNDYLLLRLEKTEGGDSNGRDIIFNRCIDVFLHTDDFIKLLFGYGFDGTINHPDIHKYAHNDWLEILIDYGVIGVLLYLYVFITFIRRILHEKNYVPKMVLISVVSILLLKSMYSMGFTEHYLAFSMMCVGAVIGGSNYLSIASAPPNYSK